VPTLQGGGIVFPIAWLGYSLWNGMAFPFFTLGLLLVAAISFADDVRTIRIRWRLAVQAAAFTLCFQELHVFAFMPVWQWPLLYLVCIGVVNAYNFMDGVNGITGLYTLAVLIPLAIDAGGGFAAWQPDSPFLYLIAAVLAFGFFNFRKKALCFAGDVGSVGIGFTLVFLLLARFLGLWEAGTAFPAAFSPSVLPTASAAYQWPVFLMLALYGADTVLTIAYRLSRREDIFKAHRLHFYQYLANEKGWPHLRVAGAYAVLQLALNLWVVFGRISLVSGIGVLLVLAGGYVGVLRRRWLVVSG
jgi:UDP-N-acetylmuramyl pentapeptide phosphotransferase/UDP-N-acetylglucosamine-1-phosphate transferase